MAQWGPFNLTRWRPSSTTLCFYEDHIYEKVIVNKKNYTYIIQRTHQYSRHSHASIKNLNKKYTHHTQSRSTSTKNFLNVKPHLLCAVCAVFLEWRFYYIMYDFTYCPAPHGLYCTWSALRCEAEINTPQACSPCKVLRVRVVRSFNTPRDISEERKRSK